MLISFDFWDTLYNHSGTKESRMVVVNKYINDYFSLKNIPFNNIDNIFLITDKYIKSQHYKNIFPDDEIIGEYVSNHYDYIFDKYFFIELKKQIEELYVNVIKPLPIEGVKEFIANNSSNHKFCITSDTFFIRGKTIREILRTDGLLKHFDFFFFSDELGYSKTDNKELESFIKQYHFNKKEVVHVGDSIETDGVFAINSQIKFIHFLSDLTSTSSQKYFFNSYSQLESILNTINI